MIAKKIPTREPQGKMTYGKMAALYGLTEEELRKAAVDFLQCEGYVETRNTTHECQTLHEYLTFNPAPYRDPTPYQKGDDQPE